MTALWRKKRVLFSILFTFAVAASGAVLLLCTFRRYEEGGQAVSGLMYVSAVALIFYVCIVVLIAHLLNWRAERMFALVFIPVSLCMMMAMPLGRVPDEPAHLNRVWLLSEVQVFNTDATEPAGLLNGIDDQTSSLEIFGDGGILSKERVPTLAGLNTAIYPPLSYLPQAVGMALTRIITKARIPVLYGGRLGGWAVTVFLLWMAIRLLPKGKNILIAFSLLPLTLQEGMSASVDGLAFGAAALLVAWVIRLRTEDIALTASHVIRLTLLCMLVMYCKMLYTPLILLPVVLKKNQWQIRGGKAAGLAVCWVLHCCWPGRGLACAMCCGSKMLL